jgi:putative heme degradation protein
MSEKYRKISLGWFFFPSRPAKVTDQTLQIALCNIVAQVADHDAIYSKAIAASIANSAASSPNLWSASSIWKEFIASQYPEKSSRKLYLVLVGIDKMEQVDQASLEAILENIRKDKLNIRVMLVGQPNKHVIYHQIGDEDVPEIEVTVENMEDDMKLYVESQIQKSKTLRKLNKDLKDMITAKFLRNDGGMY